MRPLRKFIARQWMTSGGVVLCVLAFTGGVLAQTAQPKNGPGGVQAARSSAAGNSAAFLGGHLRKRTKRGSIVVPFSQFA